MLVVSGWRNKTKLEISVSKDRTSWKSPGVPLSLWVLGCCRWQYCRPGLQASLSGTNLLCVRPSSPIACCALCRHPACHTTSGASFPPLGAWLEQSQCLACEWCWIRAPLAGLPAYAPGTNSLFPAPTWSCPQSSQLLHLLSLLSPGTGHL